MTLPDEITPEGYFFDSEELPDDFTTGTFELRFNGKVLPCKYDSLTKTITII